MKSLIIFSVIMILFFNFQVQGAVRQGCEHARIYGATFGITDITHKLAHGYNSGTRTFEATTAAWGTENTFEAPTMTVVYERCGNLAIETALFGESVTLPWVGLVKIEEDL